MSERRERAFNNALSGAKCPRCKGRILEVQRPKVICSKCGTHYILAVQFGTFLLRYNLIEDIPTPPPQIQQVKETITKEVVLFPCQYCGGLIQQTAIFCSNCGARRKG